MMRFIRRVFVGFTFAICMVSCMPKPCRLSDTDIGKDVAEILQQITKSDRKSLECFFRSSLCWGGPSAYVLFGEKPMAFDIVTEKVFLFKSLNNFRHYFVPRRIKIAKGYRTWKKYEKFFPLNKFIIFYEDFSPSDQFPKNPMLTIVNKEKFKQQVETFCVDFEEALGRKVTAEELLQEGKTRPFIMKVLQDHEILLGILLGYGRNNGYLCHQLNQLSTVEEQETFCEERNFRSAWTDEEFAKFCKQFESVSWFDSYVTGNHLKDLNRMALPGFAAVQGSQETEYLRKHYLETKQAIISYYEGKDFLEATLRVLTQ